MKKILSIILAVLTLCTLFGCGSDGSTESSAPTSDTGTQDSVGTDSSITVDSTDTSTDSSAPTDGGEDDGADEKEGLFKVYLELNGAPFVPEGDTPVTVVWSDGLSYSEADANENGIASIEGLNGDYVVTLKNIPEGYTYNPNPYNEETKTYGYTVTNDNREITIELYKLSTTKGAGSTEYNRAVMTRTGVYRATLTSSEHKIFFEFAPKSSGTYTIESWLPVTDDKINPKIDVYTSSFAAPIYLYTLDAGGAEGKNYTKNFKYEVEIADEMISSGGQVVFVFCVYTTARNDRYYPVNVDFAVQYEGGFELDRTVSNFMVPNELYAIMAEQLKEMKSLSYEEFYAEYVEVNGKPADEIELGELAKAYDGLQNMSTAKLSDGLTLNAYLNGFSGLLNMATRRLQGQLNEYYEDIEGKTWKNSATEINGTKVLIGTDYKYNEATGFYHKYDKQLYASDPYGYGEGYGPVLYADITSPVRTGIIDEAFTTVEYRGNKALTVSNGTENYKFFIESYVSAQNTSTAILGGPIECPSEYENLIGYATIVNSDGAAPVTRELMEFLQKYAINQAMFMDGDGWAENEDNPYQATENDQWLFACGYYE